MHLASRIARFPHRMSRRFPAGRRRPRSRCCPNRGSKAERRPAPGQRCAARGRTRTPRRPCSPPRLQGRAANPECPGPGPAAPGRRRRAPPSARATALPLEGSSRPGPVATSPTRRQRTAGMPRPRGTDLHGNAASMPRRDARPVARVADAAIPTKLGKGINTLANRGSCAKPRRRRRAAKESTVPEFENRKCAFSFLRREQACGDAAPSRRRALARDAGLGTDAAFVDSGQ